MTEGWSIWEPASWRSGQACSAEVEPCSSLPNMCPAVWSLILNNLDWQDLKVVRQVCSSLKADIERLVEVRARFEPCEQEPEPKPGLLGQALKYFSDKYSSPHLSPAEKTVAKAKGMEAWLPQVTLKSLRIRRLSVFPFIPTSTFKRPLRLQRLVLDFDEKSLTQQVQFQVTEMLDVFDNLTVLNVTFRPPTYRNDEVYRAAVSILLEDVRRGLQFKPKLKEVSVVVNIHWAAVELQLLEMSEDLELGPNFPKGLGTLELSLPTRLYPQKAWNWTAILNRQERLERLKVNLGHMHWTCFCSALQKNAESLRHLDLFLSVALNNDQLTGSPAPEDQWLDWNRLAVAQNLESLRINEPGGHFIMRETGSRRLRSRNFLAFDLPHIQRLELRAVFLGRPELEKIFLGLPTLLHVLLDFCSEHSEYLKALDHPEVQVESIERAQYTCDVLARALLLNRLQTIRLTDYMVCYTPQFLRDRIPKLPNYRVTWPREPSQPWKVLPVNQVDALVIQLLYYTPCP